MQALHPQIGALKNVVVLVLPYLTPQLSVVGHRAGVQRDRNLWLCDDRKGNSPEYQQFLSIFPNETAALS